MEVEVCNNKKNNGIVRVGLILSEKNVNISPTIYMEEYYKLHQEGCKMDDLARAVLELYENVKFDNSWENMEFMEYESIKDNIVIRLVQKKRNQELLKEIPYVPMLDLAVVFYMILEVTEFGMATMRVSNDTIERWNVNVQQLMALSWTDRAMLAQGFAWYMQHGSYNRTKGQTVKLIGYIKGFPAAKQIVLYDQIYTAAKAAMEDYTVTQKCYKLVYNGNSFQPIAVFKVVADPKPRKKKVEVSDSDSLTQKVNLNVVKTDALSDAGLGGAKFKVTCNGKKITTLTTDAKGKASYEHKRTLKTKKYSLTKTYITNWDDLDREARTKLTKNGYYQNKSKAIQAAKSEINKKIKAELENLKAKTYDWKVTELEAPFGHKINTAEKAKTESSKKKELTFRFTDLPEDHSITMKKVSETGEYGLEATVKDAVYGLFAAEPIYDTDNKTVLYKRNALVADLTTDKNGKASISELKPGKYYLQERIAPEGFELSD